MCTSNSWHSGVTFLELHIEAALQYEPFVVSLTSCGEYHEQKRHAFGLITFHLISGSQKLGSCQVQCLAGCGVSGVVSL